MVQGKLTKISKMFFIFLVGVALALISSPALANHLDIDNFQVSETNQSSNTITFSADVSWENSWRSPDSHDAVWIFLKYSTDAGVTWHHATLASNGTNPNGFYVPANFEVVVPSDKKGLFLQRTDLNSNNVTVTGVQFVWDYNQDGLSDEQAMAANTVNKVFGIEMIYIPQGSFYAGDGTSSSDYKFKQGSSDEDPWYIQSEAAITTTNAANDGYYYTSTGAGSENSTGSIFTIPTSFPKGYKAFYTMKYELTEGQWVSFFNTLSSQEKIAHDITSSALGGKNSDGIVNRNTIAWDSSSDQSSATTSRPNRPITYISWPDMAAYADWAALRPITELEYEKIGRGADIAPLADEFAWGKTTYNQAEVGEIYPDAAEDGTEQIFDGGANLNRNNLGWSSGDGRAGGDAAGQPGPLRVGIFAEGTTNRTTSGSGYYGNMELSGNLSEMIVTVGRSEGRQFLGTNGDGQLTTLAGYEGNATNSDWPGISSSDPAQGVIETAGSGFRGGDFNSPNLRFYQLSSRSNAVKDPDSNGYLQRYDASFGVFGGGRLGRTAQ